MVSGGNMANLVCFWAARAARAGWDVRQDGTGGAASPRLRVYGSAETHTWIQKAADLSGLGTASIRWIPVDADQRMDVDALRRAIEADVAAGDRPLLVVGTAGTVSTGAVDPLPAIAAVCREHGVWFHVDGAYGGFAAAAPDAPADLAGIGLADSIAVDPHKWLYAPLEAGCALVRDAEHLRAAFAYHPPYYHFEERVTNFVDYGPQNSRGFRALKVWLALRQVGASGYRTMIGDDMRLARALADAVRRTPELELFTQSLSITTFRYVPAELAATDRRSGGRRAPGRDQPRAARSAAARRRAVRLERRRRRPLRAARVRRELPDDAGGHRRDPGDRRPRRPRRPSGSVARRRRRSRGPCARSGRRTRRSSSAASSRPDPRPAASATS